jgi:hypothetical protein
MNIEVEHIVDDQGYLLGCPRTRTGKCKKFTIDLFISQCYKSQASYILKADVDFSDQPEVY